MIEIKLTPDALAILLSKMEAKVDEGWAEASAQKANASDVNRRLTDKLMEIGKLHQRIDELEAEIRVADSVSNREREHATALQREVTQLRASARTPGEAEQERIKDLIRAVAGSNKIQAIRAVRELTGLSLLDSKNLVEAVPTCW